MTVGIVGVGLMGHGIARNVMRKGGYALGFLDHPGNQPVDELIGLGATRHDSAGSVAAASDVVILCVTGAPQVEAVVTGEGGLLAGLKPGTVIVDCSTSLPETTRRMAEIVAAAGGAYLDAPMTRTANHAHAGTLNLLVGGAAEVLDQVRPVLASFTEEVVHVGAPGQGHQLKLLHNYVSIGFMTLLAEAAAHAADSGIDGRTFAEVLGAGGGASAALDRLAPYITEGDRNGLPFAISNAQKDIDYFRTMAEAAGAQTTIADGVAQAIAAPIEAGEGGAYLPELIRLFRVQAND